MVRLLLPFAVFVAQIEHGVFVLFARDFLKVVWGQPFAGGGFGLGSLVQTAVDSEPGFLWM
jgi:hypothetical protein